MHRKLETLARKVALSITCTSGLCWRAAGQPSAIPRVGSLGTFAWQRSLAGLGARINKHYSACPPWVRTGLAFSQHSSLEVDSGSTAISGMTEAKNLGGLATVRSQASLTSSRKPHSRQRTLSLPDVLKHISVEPLPKPS